VIKNHLLCQPLIFKVK